MIVKTNYSLMFSLIPFSYKAAVAVGKKIKIGVLQMNILYKLNCTKLKGMVTSFNIVNCF